MASASKLKTGSHSARWGNWVVGLRGRNGLWNATVWRWPPNKSLASRVEIAANDKFASAADAATWASKELVRDGAIVMVLDAPKFMLMDALDFVPAPEAVD